MTAKEIEFKEKLIVLLTKFSVAELSKHFGVSRYAVYKWLKKYDIDLKEIDRSTITSRYCSFDKKNKIADKLLNK